MNITLEQFVSKPKNPETLHFVHFVLAKKYYFSQSIAVLRGKTPNSFCLYHIYLLLFTCLKKNVVSKTKKKTE